MQYDKSDGEICQLAMRYLLKRKGFIAPLHHEDDFIVKADWRVSWHHVGKTTRGEVNGVAVRASPQRPEILSLYKKQFKRKFHFSVQLQMIRSERKDVTYLVASAVARTCSYSCIEEEASTRSVCVRFGEFWCYECFREHWSMSYWTAHAVFPSRRPVRGTLFSSDTFSTPSHLFWGFHREEKYLVPSPPPTPDVGELSGGENQSKNLKCICWQSDCYIVTYMA
jgi:hypothetical protein